MRRVVITGIGVICALGNNASDFWESIKAGRSGIGPITKADVSEIRFKNAAEVRGFDETERASQPRAALSGLKCCFRSRSNHAAPLIRCSFSRASRRARSVAWGSVDG